MKNFKGIRLTAKTGKVYDNLLLKSSLQIEKIVRKNQIGFWKDCYTTSLTLTIQTVIEGVWVNNLEIILLFVDFFKAFHSRNKENIVEILLEYGLPIKQLTFCKNTKAMVKSLDGDYNFFDIISGVFQGDSWTPYLFIFSRYYVLKASKGLMRKKSFLHLKRPEVGRYLDI